MSRTAWVLTWLTVWLLASSTALASPPDEDGEWVEDPIAEAEAEAGDWVEDPVAEAEAGEWVEDPNVAPDPGAEAEAGEWVEDPNVVAEPGAEAEAGEWVEDSNVAGEPTPEAEAGEWVEDPNVAAEPSGDELDPVYYDPGAELSDEEIAALTAMLEQELGDSEAIQALAASGYVLCNPALPRDQMVECIRSNLGVAEAQVRAKALAQIEERDANRLGTIAIVVFFAGFAGILLLATPLFVRNRYPNQGPQLFKFSVLATVLFGLNMFLFATALFILRIVQSVGAQEISPKLAMVDASFTVLKEQAGDLVDLFPVLFEPTIVQLAEGSNKDMTVLLLENIGEIQADLAVFKQFAGVFRAVNSVMEYSDIAFGLIAVVVFSIGFKDVFLDIIKLPVRAIEAPNDRAGRTIARSSLARSLREMLVVIVMIFVILTLTAIAGWTMRLAVGPAIEALLGFVVMGVFHVQMTPDASTFSIYLGLGCVALILLLNIAVVMVSNVLFLSRAQKLVRARFQQKVPLKQNWKFFVFGLLIVVGVQLLPWVYLELASGAFDMTMGKLLESDDPPFGFVLGFGGFALLGCWLLAFWGARGVAGLRYLLKYELPKPAAVNLADPSQTGTASPSPSPVAETITPPAGNLAVEWQQQDARPGRPPTSGAGRQPPE